MRSERLIAPDYQGVSASTRHRNPKATIALAQRLFDLRDRVAALVASRLERCAASDDGWRCGNVICPRCQARLAKLRRQAVERELHQIPRTVHVTMITLTIGCDEIVSGRKHLIAAFADLRRAPDWAGVVIAGRAQLEVLPATGGSRKWNVHLHTLVYARSRMRAGELRSRWQCLVSQRSLAGSFYASRVVNRFVRDACEGARGARFQSMRLLRDQTTARRTAGVYRRTTFGLPPWDTRASMGHSLRKDSGGVVTRPRCRRLPNKTEREPVDGSETSGRPDVLTQVRRTK